MRCASCNYDNPADASFCEGCGGKLELICPTCKLSVSPGARFCKKCGTAIDLTKAAVSSPVSSPKAQIIVADDSVASKAPGVPAPEVAGERRHLTILFCDLVGSTEIAAQLDPEEWRAVVAGYHGAATEAITRYGGYVAKYLGDGVMAYFGWPAAHDNDAERAVRAGLAILDAMTQLNEPRGQIKLVVRIGINSGHVVVGPGAGVGQAVDAYGDAANIASRVQAAADPETVLIADATQRLVAGLFVVEDRGAQELKGVERRIQLYRVIRPSGVRGLAAMAAVRGMTPFVGRDDELRSLQSRWERVLEREGQVVLISGEAGIGKSRVVQRFCEQIGHTPHTWIAAGASAFFQNTPFYPVTEMLHQFFGDTAEPEALALFESRLVAVGLEPAEAVPVLAPLLKLPSSAKYPASTLPPEQERSRLLATLVEWVLGAARVQPLVIVIEDLHWVDPSTLELIQLLVEQGAPERLLLLYTARPDFRDQWPQRAHHAQIRLNRLSARDIRTMIAQVATSEAFSDETVATLIERTGGVPLFVEELTRSMLEGGDTKVTGHEIPATLHDSLMARLDRLGPAKEVIQVGAVIGSDFSYQLLHAVHPTAEADLQRALSSLIDAELLYVRGIAPEATYQFKHALIRDAAYAALLKSRRKELHLEVARTIDEKFTILRDTRPEVLARHWGEAGDGARAVQYLNLAGEQAAMRAGHTEAIAHFSKALDWLERLPPPIDDAQRCSLLLELGREQRKAGEPLRAQETFIRSATIAQTLGATESVVNVALELVRMAYQIGLSSEAPLRLLDDALQRVGPGDSVLKAKALGGLAIVLGVTGAQSPAIEFAEQGIAMSRRLNDAEVLELTLQGANYALQGPEQLERRLALAKERAELVRTVIAGKTFRDQLPDAQIDLSHYLMERGDLSAADDEFAAWAQLVEEQRRPFEDAIIANRGAARALMRGDFEQSEKLARQAFEIGQRLRADNVAAGLFGMQMFALSRERGQLRELEPVVRLFVQQNSAADTWRPGLAVIYSELGRTEEARAEFEHMASDNFDSLPRDSLWIGTMTYLVDVCVFLGDRSRAAILYELLEPFAGRNVVIGYEVVCYGALSRYLGALTSTLERWDDAVRHFEDALAMNARMEAWPWLAHTQYQYATMLLSRDLAGDRDRAFALLDSAFTTARRLGMQGIEGRVAALLQTSSKRANAPA